MSRFRFTGDVSRVLRERLPHLAEAMAVEVANEIKTTINESDPSGRTYQIPGTKATYTASAPGQPPAIREGVYLNSWYWSPAIVEGRRVLAFAYSVERVGAHGEYMLGRLLEEGTGQLVGFPGQMEPRPHIAPALESVRPKLLRLIREAEG